MSYGPIARRRAGRRGRPSAVRPLVERREERALLARLLVTTTADSGPGSLRQAILDAASNPGPDSINFDITPLGTPVIEPLTELPQLSDAGTIIDATTQ